MPVAFRSVEALFRPKSIALVGASESSAAGWSRSIFSNIEYGKPDVAFYPLNPRREEVWGRPCYPSFAAIPEPVDLALVITPAATIPDTLREGLAHGLRAATIYAAGFGEGGDPAGLALAAELQTLADAGLRICGPNCMGTLSPAEQLYLYPVPRVRSVQAGNVGLIMQSGGLFQYWAQYAATRGIGLSYAVSSGNELDLDLSDYIQFLVYDPSTSTICILAEGIHRPDAFMAAAANALAARKPILITKIGRSEGAKASAQSHTGSLAGDDRVFDAVCERYGIVRMTSVDEMIESTLAFRSGRLPAAPGTMFVGYSGSARGLILDAVDEAGVQLAQLTTATLEALAPLVDPVAVLENPIDLGASISRQAKLYAQIVEVVATDPNATLVAFQAQLPLENETFDPEPFAQLAASTDKALFAYARTPQNVGENGRVFQTATNVSHLQGVPRMVNAARQLVAYAERLKRPIPHAPEERSALSSATAEGLLAAAGISLPGSALATSVAGAIAHAERIGYPVALKLHSLQPIHKTEAGGVLLDLRDRAAVERAATSLFAVIAASPELGCDGLLVQEMVAGLELIVGARVDPQFGPVILLGLGGIFVEAFDDLALRLLPVTPGDVRAMLASLRGSRLLDGFRGGPARDVEAVVEGVVALGDAFLAAGSDLIDLEINPLTVLEVGRGVRAVDVRAVYAETETA
jgi:acyl-CoA synthetase (NDP forming)